MIERPERGELEQVLDRMLRDLPRRRAPASLEARVLGELQRRAALPWWRHSFGHWPLPVRSALILVCVALVGLTLVGGTVPLPVFESSSSLAAMSLSWVNPVLTKLVFTGDLPARLEGMGPPPWLYAGLSVTAMLYAILFGLGAAAYRMLYRQPSDGGVEADE